MRPTPIGELELTGEQAKAYREKKGIKQVEMAKALGLSQGQMSHYEHSKNLRVSSIAMLATYWKVTPQQFVREAKKAAGAS